MADFDVIAAVSETLKEVLTEGLETLATSPGDPTPEAIITDLSAAPATTPPALALFLYEIVEDPSGRNRPPSRGVSPPRMTSRKPPMSLLLRYLLSAWSPDPVTDQKILGRTLQVLYDRPTLSGPELTDALAGSPDALHVTMAPLSLEERTRVWHAVNQRYRPSLNYEVRIVKLAATEEKEEAPVASRDLTPALPEGGR